MWLWFSQTVLVGHSYQSHYTWRRWVFFMSTLPVYVHFYHCPFPVLNKVLGISVLLLIQLLQ